MNISVEKQTPVMAVVSFAVIVAAAYLRFAVAPYDNETAGAWVLPTAGEYISQVAATYPVWSIVISAALTFAAGIFVVQTGNRFALYPSQTFLSLPLFGFAACGIFISADTLVASLSTFLAAMTLWFICRGYLRERDLSAMLYAGLSIGVMVLVSKSGAVYVAAALSAIFILSFSARELFVLFVAMLLPPALCCYGVWALGGDFIDPVMQFREALIGRSPVGVFGDNAVGALVMCGLLGFVLFFSSMMFLANRFMVSVKSRGILMFGMALACLSVLMTILPSATPAEFAVAAVPVSVILPVWFMREERRFTAILYLSLWIVFALHLFYY